VLKRHENGINFFTRQYKYEKKSDSKTCYTAIDKSNQIRLWLEDVADAIMENDGGKYKGIYQKAEKTRTKQNKKIEIASFEIQAKSEIFLLPDNLTVKEIAEELVNNPIEMIMDNEENPFNGCRLKLHPFYGYCSTNINIDNPYLIPSAMTMGVIIASPFFVIEDAIQEQQLLGFKIELDASPRPNSKCSIS